MPDFNNPYYPYQKVQTSYNTMRGAGLIPKQLVTYLLDLPDGNGYVPVDNNERARVRLAKYLWYDCENPLDNPLPSPSEKLSMLWDGKEPAANTDEDKAKHPRGYRLFPIMTWQRSELIAKTGIKVYLGRVISNSPIEQNIGVTFDIFCAPEYETTMRTEEYSKAFAMECAVVEALHGVNIAGVGVVEFSRFAHGDNGSRYLYNEAGENVGRRLQMSLTWMESMSGNGVTDGSGCQRN